MPGMIETRKSMVFCLNFMRKRPSWGMRFSAMSSSEMTLSRVSRKEWKEQSSGSMIRCRMPSMRYLMTRASPLISIWMSEAFLFTAVRMMLLSSLMTESSSSLSVMLSMVTTSSSSASVAAVFFRAKVSVLPRSTLV